MLKDTQLTADLLTQLTALEEKIKQIEPAALKRSFNNHILDMRIELLNYDQIGS